MMKIGDVIDVVETPRSRAVGNPRWHLAQTETGRERLAHDRLNEAGYEVYFPQMRVMKPVPRKMLSKRQRIKGASVKRPHLSALFPGYVMIRFDKELGGWHDIFDFAHVRGLVVSDLWDADRKSPDEIVDHLRGVEIDGAVPGDTPVAVMSFSRGETVRISSGPFASYDGVIKRLPTGRLEELDESARIQLVVNIFGGATKVEVEIGQIEHI